MEHTYEELSIKTVAQLREIAEGIESEEVRGFSTMHKEHLLPAICRALGIDAHAHHHVEGLDKTSIKAQIRALKGERDAAVEAHDRKQLKVVRRKIHRLKRKLHKATV